MADFEMASLEEIATVEDHDRPSEDDSKRWRQIRHHLGITAFGVNAWTADTGGLINEHNESDNGQDELYIVLSGRAAFVLDGERHDAPAGTFLYVKPGVTRSATAEDTDTTVVVVGAPSGRPYEVSGFELFRPVWPLYTAGDYDAAIDAARPLAEENPAYPLLWYNLACCESLAGRHGDAIEHLRRAIGPSEQSAMTERLRKLARDDSDLDSIRADPGFSELLDS